MLAKCLEGVEASCKRPMCTPEQIPASMDETTCYLHNPKLESVPSLRQSIAESSLTVLAHQPQMSPQRLQPPIQGCFVPQWMLVIAQTAGNHLGCTQACQSTVQLLGNNVVIHVSCASFDCLRCAHRKYCYPRYKLTAIEVAGHCPCRCAKPALQLTFKMTLPEFCAAQCE